MPAKYKAWNRVIHVIKNTSKPMSVVINENCQAEMINAITAKMIGDAFY
jgi:hypothetical protein